MTPINVITKYNLVHYFYTIWNSKSANLPYHNLEHLLGVMMAVHDGCQFYAFDYTTTRLMLIAALLHDYNHTGVMGDDAINIKLAIEGMREHILEDDKKYLSEIESYIQCTQFPHTHIEDTEENLPLNIMRDADVSYTLKDDWTHVVCFGIGSEMSKTPEEMLKMQIPFMENYLVLSTGWGKEKFSQKIKERITEVKEIIKVLYP
jgi:hypothetical protein